MSWSFTPSPNTPQNIESEFQQHIESNPLQGAEKNVRSKIKDILVEVRKGTAEGTQIAVSMSGSANIVDDVQVSQTVNISITPVAA